MHEIELKLQVPRERRVAVASAVAGRTPARRVRLQAAYWDTPDRLLAGAGLALRLRREGRVWVQTLKGGASDGLTRPEHNVALRHVGADLPDVDPARHAGTPSGAALLKLLHEHPEQPLGVRYRTDILRRTRVLRSRLGSVELAYDEGHVFAGERSLPVCELEIELLRGAPALVVATARDWVRRHGLWQDTRSKAERGDLLARGLTQAPARGAEAPTLRSAWRMDEARAAVLRSCVAQVRSNASQVASGEHDDEHVHQLRIGLRRLRSGLRLFSAEDTESPLGQAAAGLFRRLGAARDRDVVRAAFAGEIGMALRRAVGPLAIDAQGAPPHGLEGKVPMLALREVATQELLLELLEAGLDAPVQPPPVAEPQLDLRQTLARRIERWHRKAVADAARYDALDDAGRHRLRKRIKRLRYALEFCAALYPRRALRRYLKRLRALQDRLGDIADAGVAVQAMRARHEDAQAWFALGWLSARGDLLLAQAQPALKAYAQVPRAWKSRD